MGKTHEFGDDTNDGAELKNALYALSEEVGRILRRQRRAARRLQVRIDYTDGRTTARYRPLNPPSADDPTLFAAAVAALDIAWTRRTRVRRIGLTVPDLVFPPTQLELFAPDRRHRQHRQSLMDAIDRIRERFGSRSLQTGRTFQGCTRGCPGNPRISA